MFRDQPLLDQITKNIRFPILQNNIYQKIIIINLLINDQRGLMMKTNEKRYGYNKKYDKKMKNYYRSLHEKCIE